MIGYVIDENNYYIDVFEILEDATQLDNVILVPPPNGLYRPKWDGNKWVNGMEQAEIDALNGQPKPPTGKITIDDVPEHLKGAVQTELDAH
jgi:hypothetical protein